MVGGTGLYLRAALAELDLRPPVPPESARAARALQRGAHAARGAARARARRRPRRSSRRDASGIIRALELLDAGDATAGRGDSQLWTTGTRHPTLLAGARPWSATRSTAASTHASTRWSPPAPAEEVRDADAAGASRRPRARRSASGSCSKATSRRCGTNTRRYAKRQLTWMRKLPGAHLIDVTGRAPEDVAAELDGMI